MPAARSSRALPTDEARQEIASASVPVATKASVAIQDSG